MPALALFGFAVLTAVPLVVSAVMRFCRWQRHYGEGSTFWGYFFRLYSGKTATEDAFPLKILWVVYALSWLGFVTSFMK